MDLVGEKQSRTYGQSWAAWFKTTTNEILNQLRANNLSELGKKLSQPHLDESFEIKSDGYVLFFYCNSCTQKCQNDSVSEYRDVSSEDEEETADDVRHGSHNVVCLICDFLYSIYYPARHHFCIWFSATSLLFA